MAWCAPPVSLGQVCLAIKWEVRLDDHVQPQDVRTVAGEWDTGAAVARGMGALGGACLSPVRFPALGRCALNIGSDRGESWNVLPEKIVKSLKINVRMMWENAYVTSLN